MYRQRPRPFPFFFGMLPPFGPPSPPPFGGPMGAPVGPPSTPPPSFVPQQGPQLFAVDPGAIRPCRFRFVYIWPTRGRAFWAWLTFVGPTSAAGFRWTGFNWVYFGMDLTDISSFQCY